MPGWMYLDSRFERSFDFSSISNMLVVAVAVGFDNSDSNCMGIWQPCNQQKSNLVLYVQTLACLEGPVDECYENK